VTGESGLERLAAGRLPRDPSPSFDVLATGASPVAPVLPPVTDRRERW